ncbi:MAG: demethylmenaquinone methyltransferase [Acidobacteria bacterium]|nr:MAG: demethylmenaquinone methyltransferase [Acidobacteriota bacterium]
MGFTKPEREHSADAHAGRVREMFARISPRYDLLNHLLSVNLDRSWRRAVIRKLRPLLSSTGDLSVELFEKIGGEIIGLDFCRPMLELARRKAPRLPLVESDALRLPFGDGSFDAVTIGFGIRNLSSVEQGLSELRRVLKPQGWAAILEFSRPSGPGFRALANIYSTRILPRLGGLISGSRSAYEYLPDSILHFPDQATLRSMMIEAGFDGVEFKNLSGGIAALHTGRRA